MALKITGPIEAFGNWFGRRTIFRRGNQTPALNKAMTRLWAISTDTANLAKAKDNPKLRVPQGMALANVLGDAGAGLDGWETRQALAGIKAATMVRQNEAAKADLNEVQ